MRGGSKGVTALKKANAITMITMLVLGTLVLAVTPPGEEPGEIAPWPNEDEWINYTFRGERIRDWEDKPYENDPTHGIANVQPAAVDIASGVDATGGGEENNPGDYTSVQYLYKDIDGNSDGFSNIDDDWLFLRMRVAADPRHGGKYAYKSYHWDILLEVDGDIWSEFVVDLNGGDGYFGFGTVGVYYNNTEDYEYDPDNDWVWLQEASKDKNKFTRAVLIDYGTPTEDDDQWWIEYRIPVTAFTDYDDNQLLGADTAFLLFFSTSASMTNPLQKDWMGEYVFGEPANITVEKTVEEGTVAPGDTIHYKIYYNNTGDFNANDVWVNDTIPEYTTYKSCSPPYNSVDDHTYRWHFNDVEPGNHTIYLNVTVDLDVLDGTILKNVVVLNYTDHQDNEQPGSEDETENPVAGPSMVLTKEAGESTANPGDIIEYIITYENTGSGGAYNVVITDTIPDHTTFDHSVPDYDLKEGNTYTWEIDYVPGNSINIITVYVKVDAYTEDGAYLVNHVTLSYQDVNENQYPDLEDWANVTVHAPMMTLSKTPDVFKADPSDLITYIIAYENQGTGDASNVVIEDTIDSNTTYVSASPAPNNIEDDVLTWNIGTVAGGTSDFITLVVKVDPYVEDGTILTNIVTLNYEDPNGNPYPEESDSVKVTVTAPLMTISKTANCEYADPGDEITYTITYENKGTGDATNVIIEDTIDKDTTYVSASPAPNVVINDVLTWNIGTVAGGYSTTITLIVKVDAYVEDKETLTNAVKLNYDDANGNPYPEESDSVEVTVTAPLMTITKTANCEYADPGDEITYTITYENKGTGDATNVVIQDTIDPDTTYVSATPAPNSIVNDVLTWNIGTVAGGTTEIITLIVKVDAYVEDKETLTNAVKLNYDDANGNPYTEESDSVDVTVTAPLMTITKTANCEYADPGDEITYTITYENKGTGDATNVVILDTIDPDTTYVSASPSPNNIVNDVLTWNLGTVAGGYSTTITLIVKVDAYVEDKETLTNSVTLDYDDANGNAYNQESDSVDVTVTAPVMSFSKIADVTKADPSDPIVYTLTYNNSGSGVATDVVITDIIPENTTFVDSNPNFDDVNGNKYTWNIGILAAYSEGTITITVTVDPWTPDGTLLHNIGTLDYADANGNPYNQLSDFADVTVTAPKMTFCKSADKKSADPGDTIVYTLYYENTGSGVATNVIVTDTIPENTTFVSSDPKYDGINGNTYTWNVGTVVGYSYGTITITVTVNPGTPDGTLLHNIATLDYDDANGNPYNQLTDDADVTVTAPKMIFSKVSDVILADPGDTIVYTLTYNNIGSGIATDLQIIDTIPENTTFMSSVPMYNASSEDTYTWNIEKLNAYSIGTIEITVTVDAGTLDGTLLHNEASLDYDDANGNPYPQQTDYADVTVTAPVLGVTKTANVKTADPGDQIIYTINFENSGVGNATNIWINDSIPACTTLVSTSPTYDYLDGDTYKWYYSLIGGGKTVTITIVVEVDVGTPDQKLLHNHVALNYSDDNGNPLDEESAFADVTVTAPILHIIKVADVLEADPGDTIIYTINYSNTGTGWATLVTIVDTIPSFTTFVGSSPAYDDVNGDKYTWNINDVAPGKNGAVIITVTVDVGTNDETLLHNVVTLDYADANGNYYQQLTDYADVIVTAPIMSISKKADVATADPGDPIFYTITYKNTGTGWASLVEIIDTIPSDTTFVSSSPACSSFIGDVYTWEFGNVSPGAVETIKIEVTVDAGTGDKTLLHNTITLDYADANGNYYPQVSDYADVIVTAPVMSLSKTADVSEADPGDTLIYTIGYENKGTGNASNVIILDTLPDEVTLISSSLAIDSIVGNKLTWNIAEVLAGKDGSITVTVTVNAGTPDKALLLNEVILDYSDANGNFIEQLADSATVIVTAPIMVLSKDLGMVKVDAYIMADFRLRIAGEKWHDVVLTLYHNGVGTEVASITRFPGDPDDQSVTIYDVKVGIIPGSFTAVIEYTPWDDVINGEYWGADPCWLILMFPDDSSKRLHHTFNVRHNDTWKWVIDDFTPFVKGQPITYEATIQYAINYENIGTGDASNVVITDILPENVTLLDSNPACDSYSGNTYKWNVGPTIAGGKGQIIINASYIFYINGTLLTNEATLDYSDANGNFIETVYTFVGVVLTKNINLNTQETQTDDSGNINPEQYGIGSGASKNIITMGTIPKVTSSLSSSPAFESSNNPSGTTENTKEKHAANLPIIEEETTSRMGTEIISEISVSNYIEYTINSELAIRERTTSTIPNITQFYGLKEESKESISLDVHSLDPSLTVVDFESSSDGERDKSIDKSCEKAIEIKPEKVQSDVLTYDTDFKEEGITEESSNIENAKNTGSLYHSYVATRDIRDAETTMVACSGMGGVSSLFLILMALLFALSALAVGVYIFTTRATQKKRR